MSIIGYTQLMKDILDVDKISVELQLEKLANHKLSGLRLKVLKQLSKLKEDTISGLLRKVGENNTGGTYKTISSFFNLLKRDKILFQTKRGTRQYWKFTKEVEDLENYFKYS